MLDIKHVYGESGPVLEDALWIRRKVFIEEQGVEEEVEMDGREDLATHYVGYLNGQPITTARVSEEEKHRYHLQRVATLKDYRSQGYGRQLIEAIESSLLQDDPKAIIWLGAQETALAFYEKMGYQRYGEPFIEANLPHQHMKKKLQGEDIT